MNVLDLFSGIGGFSLGLERAGMRTVAFCEREPYCQAVLRKHWPDVPVYDDVCTLTGDRLRADGIAVDLICGGFPCQDISVAGKGLGLAGERSGLWREFARIIGEVRPRFVIVENVSALLGRGLGDVLGDLAALGFDAEWHCIPASDVGAPHRRDRLWIVAYAMRGRYRPSKAVNQSASHEERNDSAHWERRAPIASKVRRDGDYVANDDSQRQLQSEGSEQVIGRRTCDDGREISHALRKRLPFAWSLQTGADGRHAGGEPSSSGRWGVEPDVGRVAHGVPPKLDRGRYAEEEHDAEASAQGNGRSGRLPSMRRDGAVAAASSRLLATEIGRGLMPALPHQGGPAGRDAQGPSNESMRTLRQGVSPKPQQEAFAVQPGVPFGRWPHERGEAVGEIWAEEPDVGRVASGIVNRVDRLRAIGNAVVPQIPEIIGRAILESEGARR